jgi:hypothetical protein
MSDATSDPVSLTIKNSTAPRSAWIVLGFFPQSAAEKIEQIERAKVSGEPILRGRLEG